MVSICPGRPLRQLLLLLLIAVSTLRSQELPPKDVEALLARLAESRAGSGVEANFQEERHLALMEKPVTEIGIVSFLPPDMFRREVKGGSLTVCNGDTLWIFYPQFREVEKYRLSSNRPLRESISAMTSGFGLQDLAKNYKVRAWQTADGYRIELLPKTSSLRKAVMKIQVDLAAQLYARRLEILGAEGDRTTITFSGERKVKLSPEDFRFQPPAGVRVSEPMS
jgi:outer membrane lipoprotein-sorting protein